MTITLKHVVREAAELVNLQKAKNRLLTRIVDALEAGRRAHLETGEIKRINRRMTRILRTASGSGHRARIPVGLLIEPSAPN